jgi:tetratricopeptide (TPR) repeat protein
MLVPLILVLLMQSSPTQVAVATPDQEAVRAAVQQYYAAQAARDPDRALSFWSASATPRPTREAFLAVFGEPAEDTFSVDVRAVETNGDNARVRVFASRVRLIMRDGQPITQRAGFLNSQLWRKEAAEWKLLRDGPLAEEIADDLVTAPPAERPSLYDKNSRADLVLARLAISQRATMAITLGKDYARGKALFELALEVSRACGDRRGEANSLHNIAQADYFLRDYPAATDAYEKELAVARDIDDQDAVAAAQFGLATVFYSRADYTPALAGYREALSVYEKRDDGPSISRTVVSIGNVQYLQGEYDAAAASYRRGLVSALEFGDRTGATYARRGLGRVLAAQGDIPAALDMYTRVLADARAALKLDARLTADVASTLESIGDLYNRIGNTDQARTSLDEARRLDGDDPEGAGRVLVALGVTELVAGRFDAAFAAYSEARARFETAKNPDGMARAWVGIGFSQAAREKFTDAIAAYRTAIGLFEQKRNEDGVARAWLGLSLAQSGAGDDKAALDSAGTVSTIAERITSEDLAWRGAERSGEALRKLDRLDEARQSYDRAVAAIDRLAANAPISPEARGDLGDSADAFAGLALTLAAQGDAVGALRAMETRRAHIRRVDFAAFQHDIARGATADELTEEQGIVREVISTRAQLRAETQGAHPDVSRVQHLRDQLSALTAKRADQQSRLYARLPELPLWRGLPQSPMDASELPDLVPGANGLLVAYLVTDDELLIVTVARGESGPEVTSMTKPINRRALADALASTMQPAVLQNTADWRARASTLTTALIDPIASRLEGRDRVIFVPDDLLWKVPFEALPRGDGDVASAATVTYATSLAALALQRRAAAATTAAVAGSTAPSERLIPAFLAAPTIPDPVRAQVALALPSWKLPDPAASLDAARAAAAPYGESITVQSGADASEVTIRTLLTSADVIHVQAPVQVSRATPLLSSLLLAATGDAAAEDGRFEVREWFGISGRARVFVLPDGSAFGAAGVGNALDPIAWAASAAGISTLVVGRWPADAFANDVAVAAFHAKLANGSATVDAWRAAIGAAREKNAAPSGWAGLRLIGGYQ